MNNAPTVDLDVNRPQAMYDPGTAISAVELERSFGTVRAVAPLGFTIEKGQTVAILGPNRAARSTVISLPLGLFVPDVGRTRLLGRDPLAAVSAGVSIPSHPMSTIRVMVAEDQGMVRGELTVLVGLEPDIEVVGQVGRGNAVVECAAQSQLDPLLDIEMPGPDGLSATAAVHQAIPSVAVIILNTFGRPGYLRRAMEAGAVGFSLKDGPAEGLAAAIRRAVAGERVVGPSKAAAALSTGPNLPSPHASMMFSMLRTGHRGGGPTSLTFGENCPELPVDGHPNGGCQQSDRSVARGGAQKVGCSPDSGHCWPKVSVVEAGGPCLKGGVLAEFLVAIRTRPSFAVVLPGLGFTRIPARRSSRLRDSRERLMRSERGAPLELGHDLSTGSLSYLSSGRTRTPNTDSRRSNG